MPNDIKKLFESSILRALQRMILIKLSINTLLIKILTKLGSYSLIWAWEDFREFRMISLKEHLLQRNREGNDLCQLMKKSRAKKSFEKRYWKTQNSKRIYWHSSIRKSRTKISSIHVFNFQNLLKKLRNDL